MAININTYCRINRNGSININTDPRFGAPYSTNLTIYAAYNQDQGPSYARSIDAVSINGGTPYVILNGVTLPVYDDNSTILYAHHFGGTSITVSESNNATMIILINNSLVFGSCNSPVNGTATYTGTFTENDQVVIYGDYCGA
jgi:hypothetical protein